MARWAWVGALALVLAGCGAPRAAGPGALPATAVRVAAPSFGDARPVEWKGRSPAAYPVHGIDISRWQAEIDWPRARAGGVSFAYIKATEGGDRADPGFAGHWQGAGAAGVARGAYHFFYFCTPAVVQARWFLDHLPRERGALPPALDIEWNPQSPTCGDVRPDPATVRAETRAFLDAVERATGQRPVIYTTPDFFERNGFMALAGEEVWLRSTREHPTEAYGVQGWTFWQYSGTGLVPGVRGQVDLNAFGGSAADWRAWLAARAL